MSNKLLYINNTLVDLFPDTVVAQTLQAFEVGKLGSVRLNYTNQIKIPKTPTNRRAVGFSDDSKSNTSFPYTKHSARYVENGIEIIRNGVIELKETDDSFSFNIYSGPKGFFDYIKTKKLWDLNFSDLNGPWDDNAREAKRNTATGIVAPLSDDGRITYTAPNIENNGGTNKHPWIYYHTVIDKIFSTAGYTKSGTIFSDDKYLKLAMPLSLTYAPGFIDAKRFSAAAPGTQSIVDPATPVTITFNQTKYNGSDGFYNGIDTYTVTNPDSTGTYFHSVFHTQLSITVVSGTVDIKLEIVGGISGSVTKLNVGTGVYAMLVSKSAGMAHGDIARVTIIKNTGTPTVTIDSGVFYNVLRTGVTGDNLESTLATGHVYFNLLFEDIKQTDFLTDFCVRFNVRMTERNGAVICKTMDEVMSGDKLDWTSKRIPGKETLKYAYNGLAQKNYFTYQIDNITPNLPKDHGKGVFNINNTNIAESQNIYDSMFAATEMASFQEKIFMAKASVNPVSSNIHKNNLGIRLLYMRDSRSDEPGVIYVPTGLVRTDYKVAYFIDARYSNSMHYQFFIDNYYTKFVARLQKHKTLVRSYNLTAVDIASFDQLKPIHDSSETFIVTKIINFISGRSTQVELFKI